MFGEVMIKITDKNNCCGCSSCANICPKQCIKMVEDFEGFFYPEIDFANCVQCDLCTKSCPTINKSNIDNKPIFYGCFNKDEIDRKSSSSGGVFHLLCEYVISRNGVVFGAAFDDKFNVLHSYADNMDDCIKFKGSKYLQSVIGKSYIKAKKFLDEDRLVLFSGTPCQIEGLVCFLKKEYSNLITQDIVCHSVPSLRVWEEYKKYISDNKTITNIDFRNKKNGWDKGTFIAKFDDGSVFEQPYTDTEYIKGFLNGLYSRPSCYDCKFSNLNRVSDITLGDFWGVQSFYPDLYDNKGTSIVLVNSPKGKKLINELKKDLVIKKVNVKKATWYNPAIHSSVKLNPNRKEFFDDKSNNLIKTIDGNIIYLNKEKNEYKFSLLDKFIIKYL